MQNQPAERKWLKGLRAKLGLLHETEVDCFQGKCGAGFIRAAELGDSEGSWGWLKRWGWNRVSFSLHMPDPRGSTSALTFAHSLSLFFSPWYLVCSPHAQLVALEELA